MLFQHEFPSLRLLPFHPLSLFPSLPLLSVSLFLYLYRYPRAPSPPILSLVHFMRPPAKENIPRLSSQLLLSRIFHRRATRGNDRDRGERERERTIILIVALKVYSSAHVEDVSNAPTEKYVQYCVYGLLEVSIGRLM